MSVKKIYIECGSIQDQIEFSENDSIESMKETLISAAEGAPGSLLKMRSSQGFLIGVSPKIAENTPETRYKIEIVAAPGILDLNDFSKGKLSEFMKECGLLDSNIEKRLDVLETNLTKFENLENVKDFSEACQELNKLRRKVEEAEYLHWLGLSKSAPTTLAPRLIPTSKDEATCASLYRDYRKLSKSTLSKETETYLKAPIFDNWQWTDSEMMYFLQVMYEGFNLPNIFKIDLETLQNFLVSIHKNYNNNPFHNFRHCFCVAQMMYGIIWICDLQQKLTSLDLLVLLTSAICHDLDHPGLNNAYQVNAHTELAIRYNDVSPLENHHCAVAFRILDDPSTNIFKNLSKEQYAETRKGIIACILATDMARHGEILSKFKAIMDPQTPFDYSNAGSKLILMQVLMKCSDISNEARPQDVSEPWVDCLLEEFFAQSDKEKLLGLPVAPFMDREKVSKPSAQIGFINFVLLPLFDSLANLFPQLKDNVIAQLKISHQYYTNQQKLEAERIKLKTPGTVEGVGPVSIIKTSLEKITGKNELLEPGKN